jgi:hypothetical protein
VYIGGGFTAPLVMHFIRNTSFIVFFSLVLFMGTFFFVFAEDVKFSQPTWGDVDQENPTLKSGDSPSVNDRIGYEGSDQLLTAFQFCSEFGHDFVTYLDAGTSDPTVTFKNDEWKESGGKGVFLNIVCDDGVVASTTPQEINVVIPNFPDYSVFFQFFMILFSSIGFMFFVHSFMHIIKKFL